MSAGASRRRRQILRAGRLMILSRPRMEGSLTVTGYAPPPQAAQLAEGVGKATLLVQITADETGRTGSMSHARVTPCTTDRKPTP